MTRISEVILNPSEETSILLEGDFNQNDTFPKLLHSQFSDWHNGYFISVCKKSK